MDYEDMTVAQLKDLLRDAGLPVSGKKAELIVRLQEAEDAPAEAEEVEEMDVEEDDFESDDF
ncbi:MAG: SAP domain-containing protein, partial [Candidatus Thermoplasmatota archaeon]|nr:SAP domain-containing protein [Candidatus Thermoplasmatota archaeon]